MSADDMQAWSGRKWALLLTRVVLGLLFFMAGVWKVFELGPVSGARAMFVEPYADTFLPVWALWASGVTVPFVELIAGFLLIIGLWRKPAYLALAGVLAMVTFGHLLAEPIFTFHHHVFPRTVLLVFLLWAGPADDTLSADGLLRRRW